VNLEPVSSDEALGAAKGCLVGIVMGSAFWILVIMFILLLR
jgi:hypothetical protein